MANARRDAWEGKMGYGYGESRKPKAMEKANSGIEKWGLDIVLHTL